MSTYERQVIDTLRAAFLTRLTVDSESQDMRRKGFNQAIFLPDGPAVWNRTDLGMVLDAFDRAVKDVAP